MDKIIAVVGPTASGKTALSIDLAEHINGEIISCDSMQIYKKMNIGTAKPTAEETRGITHHMIDIIEPYDNFSCADYVEAAKKCIDEIHSRNKTPIFCGGTGLYLDNVLTDNIFSEHTSVTAIREELMLLSPNVLHERLRSVDPDSADAIHQNNVKRVVRALEIYYATGKTKTQWDIESRLSADKYDAVIIGLDYRNRDTLYNRIDRRVDIMIADGLVDEVKSLDIDRLILSTAGQAIGYKEVIRYLKNECNFDDMVNEIKLNTRHYAKRQLTWFRRNEKIRWYYAEDFNEDIIKFEEIVNNLF
jgi:tRNA dimethylallyltransferase